MTNDQDIPLFFNRVPVIPHNYHRPSLPISLDVFNAITGGFIDLTNDLLHTFNQYLPGIVSLIYFFDCQMRATVTQPHVKAAIDKIGDEFFIAWA